MNKKFRKVGEVIKGVAFRMSIIPIILLLQLIIIQFLIFLVLMSQGMKVPINVQMDMYLLLPKIGLIVLALIGILYLYIDFLITSRLKTKWTKNKQAKKQSKN